MDIEKLEICNTLTKEINELREFIDVLKNQYVNGITGFSWKRGEEQKHYFELKGELREIVISYLQNKLDLKEDEFKRL